VVRFSPKGKAEVALTLGQEAEGLAFGLPGTLLENLAFVSHETGGTLTLVDLVSMKAVEIATGGARGDFLHVGPDGRLYMTQSTQVDVLFPVTPPHVVATTPVSGSNLQNTLRLATVTFDVDMDESSVRDLGNYRLRNLGNATDITVGSAVYDVDQRTVQLQFEALARESYELWVAPAVTSAAGLTMESPYTASFSILDDVSAILIPEFTNTRLNRADGTVLFDATVTNGLASNLAAPIRLVFDGLADTGITLVNPDGYDSLGHPYVDLIATPGTVLAPGQSSPTRTIAVADAPALALDLAPRVLAGVDPNQWPTLSTQPSATATVGEVYRYAAAATDPDSASLAYVLIDGPEGANVDPASGTLVWTPPRGASQHADFDLRVYDARGGYARQQWTVSVADANSPPTVMPIPDQTVREGQWLEVPVAGFDAEGDALAMRAARLSVGGRTLSRLAGIPACASACPMAWQTVAPPSRLCA
jgi:hypothetical protein